MEVLDTFGDEDDNDDKEGGGAIDAVHAWYRKRRK